MGLMALRQYKRADAVSHVWQRDCTGTVDKDGKHSGGKPNCPPAEKFDNELHAIELGITPAPPPPAPPTGTIPMP